MDGRRRAIQGIAKSGGRLPSEYQEVEYLESTGQQYIDSGITSNLKYLVSTKFSYPGQICTRYYNCGDNSPIVHQGNNGYSLDTFYVHHHVTGQSNNTISLIPNKDIEIEETLSKLYVNGVGYNWVGASFSDTSGNHYFLFGRENNMNSCKIFYWKLLDSEYDTLLCDFIPCYRKADNKPGLYDLANDVFYTNANTSASQDFIVGPNV